MGARLARGAAVLICQRRHRIARQGRLNYICDDNSFLWGSPRRSTRFAKMVRSKTYEGRWSPPRIPVAWKQLGDQDGISSIARNSNSPPAPDTPRGRGSDAQWPPASRPLVR